MANRTVTVRYILDASGYRSGANDIAAADARIASTARASAAAMGQTQQKAERAQQNATRSYVAGGKAQEAAVKRVGAATTAQARIIEDAERRKARVQEDASRRIVRVQQDTARRISQVQNESARQQIAQSAALRQARIREDAASRVSRIGVDAGIRADRSGADETRSLVARAGAYQQVGRTAAVTGGVLAAALALSGRAAVQWQSDFAGVTKTVDFSNKAFGSATEQQDRLEGQLRGLARAMPETHTEIAAVAEAAGQLGIATPNVAAFTKTMIQLGDTTNLSSDEAATSIAQLGNIMGTLKGPADQVNDNISRIGATIVGLGNNGASTERDITQMGLRIASAGRTIGLNTGQVLGFASAIASTGVEVEAGGTAFSNFALKVDGAVREGGPKLDLLAKTAGESSEQFKKSYQKDAAGALTDFVEGLQRVAEKGGDTNRVLKQLGVTGIREADTVRRLALSGSLLRDSLSDQARFYKENNALSNEANKRYQTEASRIQIAQNKIKDDAITAGAAILPALAKITDGVGKMADKFANLSPATQGFAVKAAGIAGGILLVGGGALTAVGSVAQLGASLKDLGASTGSLKTLGAAAGVTAAAFIAMQVAGAAVKGIIGVQSKTSTDAAQAISGLGDSIDRTTPSLDKFFTFKTTGDILGRTDIDSLAGAFDRIGGRQGKIGQASDAVTGFLSTLGFAQSGAQVTKERFSQLDASLASLGTQNAPEAAKAFQKIADAAAAQGVPVSELVDLFPTYSKAVIDANAATGGLITSDDQLSDLMKGKVAPAFKSIAQAQAEQTQAMFKQDEAVGNGVTSLSRYIKAQRDGGDTSVLTAKASQQLAQALFSESQATIAASNARVAYSQAQQAAAAQGKKSNAGIGAGTGLGKLNAEQQQNIGLLNQQAAAFQNVAQNMVVTGKSAKQVGDATKTARKQFIDNATAMGASKSAASKLADSYGLIPKKVQTDIEAKVNTSAQTELTNFKNLVGDFPPEIKTKIEALVNEGNYKGALSKLKEFQKKRRTEVDVKANAKSADHDLNQVAGKRRKSQIDAQAKTGGAKADLDSTASKRRTSNITAKASVGAAVSAISRAARKRSMTISVNAAVGAANAAINAAARNRTATISVKVRETGRVGADIATGGLVTHAGVVGRAKVRRSNGGPVWGAGTATSDSIDAKLSNGEVVIRTAAAQKFGYGRLLHINQHGEDRGYATGGIAGSAEPGFATGGQVIAGILKYVNSPTDPLADIRKAVSDIAKARKEKKKAKSKSARKKADDDYKAATKALTEANKAAAESARQYADTLTKSYRSASTSGADLLALQQQGIADLTGLSKRLADLKKLGLSDSEIARIAQRASDGDVAGATALADSILAGGKTLVDQLNRSNKALEKIADALATTQTTRKTRGLASGGRVDGPGTATSDTAGLFALSNREWVHPVKSVDYYGEAFMAAVQNRTLPRTRVSGYMAGGGQVGGTKIVNVPLSRSDLIAAFSGVAVVVQSPITGEMLTGHIARVADQQIGSAFAGAASGR